MADRDLVRFVVLAALVVTGCLDRRSAPRGTSSPCTECHGDPTRAGDSLRRSAPPFDLRGSTNVHDPGVGAHSVHLDASATHGTIACTECHVVPDRADSPGHADSAGPAKMVFGALARTSNHAPVYDPVGRTCGNTYCHNKADAVWTEPKASGAACGSCHGLPPPAPHPASDQCWSCHGAVVDAERRFVAPTLHVNGIVEFSQGTCTDCHGSNGNAAPPSDISGNTAVTALGVGAHRTHLAGGASARPVDCTECHTVPSKVEDQTHADGLPAEVAITGVGASHGSSPRWDRGLAACSSTWCHGPDPGASGTSPPWTDATSLGCSGCHGAPPSAPHPQMNDCSLCHGAVVAADDVTILDRARHVNGTVDVAVPSTCTSCHGGTTDAAPVPGTPGAGAHRAHLDGSAIAAKVPCGTCHRVPSSVLDPDHIDTPRPAEVMFSGTALANGAVPAYSFATATCTAVPCHGAVMSGGNASGGTNTTPDWNRVDGTQSACGTCHAIPPPAPHPYVALNPTCSACHEDIASDNQTFTRPDLHVDGIVTFKVP